jgi:hypothetical protein
LGASLYAATGSTRRTSPASSGSRVEAVGIRASLCEPFLWDSGHNDTLSRMQRVRPDTDCCVRTLGQELWRNRDPRALVRGHVGMASMIGALEPGKRADIVIRTDDVAETQPGWSPLQTMLLASRSRSVDTVLVDGRIVMRGGRSTLVDEEAIYATARRQVAELAAAVGLQPESAWPMR